MGRPPGSAYESNRRIYERLKKGSLCLQDWRETGIKSRSTVHKRLKFLVMKGLITRRRKGHKILFNLLPMRGRLWYKYTTKSLVKKDILDMILHHLPKELGELEFVAMLATHGHSSYEINGALRTLVKVKALVSREKNGRIYYEKGPLFRKYLNRATRESRGTV